MAKKSLKTYMTNHEADYDFIICHSVVGEKNLQRGALIANPSDIAQYPTIWVTHNFISLLMEEI